MRIIFLSNFYPPFARGGYEQWCEETAIELVQRAHQVLVLSSKPKNESDLTDHHGVEVRQWLNLEVEAGLLGTALRLVRDRRRLEAENLRELRQLIADYQPDAAVVWGMWNVPRSVPSLVETLLPHRVAYYLCDYWPSLPDAYVQQLQNPASRGVTRLPKQLLGRLVLRRLLETPRVRLQLEHPICVSRAVRDLLVREGVPVDHARIIQGGIQIDDFRPMALPGWHRGDGEIKMLYAGRLAPEKGVHTVIRALAQLSPRADRPVTFDIVGNGERRYVDELRRLVRVGNLGDSVHFRSGVPRSAMPRLLASYDALLFPSEWQEPFGRMVMEAMAVGLVVIGTTTGGTGDVLAEGETGLTFPPGDSATLARQIERLRDDRALGRRLATRACAQISQRFTFDRMVDEIEAFLGSIASIEIAS